MASTVGGTVTWVLDVETGKFTSGLASANAAVKATANNVVAHTDTVKSSFKDTASNVANSLGGISRALGGMTIATGLAIGTSSFGLLGMAKASWGQVVAVENASFALKAYEKDATKVSQVLSGLVKYAQSDMGVLFQRQDLFDAASNLKLYGIETSKLVDYTKILSKGVAVGKTSFQELSDILGRVTSSGKLTGDQFDMLVMRGIKLPDTMRNAAVSAEQLFGALDKSLPDELLAGRANTISGIMTRLQSAFRNLGSQILGVDKDTSTFIKGGLGDTLVTTMQKLRDIMASPEMKESFANLGKTIGNFVKDVLPLLINGFMWMANNLPAVIALFGVLATTWILVSIAATAASLAALPLTWPFYAIAAVVLVLIGVLAWLQMKFGFLTKAMEFLKPVFTFVKDLFSDLWNNAKKLAEMIGKELAPVFEFVAKHAETLKKILMVTTAIAFAPLMFVIGSVIAAIKLLSIVIGFIAKHFEVIKKVLIVTTLVAFAPIILVIGSIILIVKILIKVAEWLIKAFMSVAKFTIAVWTSVWNAVVTAFNFIKDIVTTVMNAIWAFIQPILQFILNLYIIVWGTILIVITTVLKTIWNIITTVWNAIWGVISTVIQWIWNTIVNAFNFWYNLIFGVFTKVRDFISEVWNSIYNSISGILQKIIDFFAPALTWLYEKGKAIIQGLIDGVVSMATRMWNGVKIIADKIGEFFSGAWKWLYDTGKSIIEGLINGIKDMAGSLNKKVSEMADNVKNKFKDVLKINSPSKVMIPIGMSIGEGFIKGMDNMVPQINESSSFLANSAIPPSLDTSTLGNNSTTNTTISINGPINLGDKGAVNEFFGRLNRNNELAQKGMALL